MFSNQNLNSIMVTGFFIRVRKLNISLVSITQSYFALRKNRLISVCYFIMKILDKLKLQQIAFNHSSDIDFKNFINLYRKI